MQLDKWVCGLQKRARMEADICEPSSQGTWNTVGVTDITQQVQSEQGWGGLEPAAWNSNT